MTLTAELPSRIPTVIIPHAEAQGVEGRVILQAAEAAMRHWQERIEYWLGDDEDFGDEELTYENVPLETVKTIRVRYKDAGVLEPMRYEWDD